MEIGLIFIPLHELEPWGSYQFSLEKEEGKHRGLFFTGLVFLTPNVVLIQEKTIQNTLKVNDFRLLIYHFGHLSNEI